MKTVKIRNELYKLIEAGNEELLNHLWKIARSYRDKGGRMQKNDHKEGNTEGDTSEKSLSEVHDADITYMRTLTFKFPAGSDSEEEEIKMAFASKLYELGKITLGQGAEMTGCTKEHFMSLLADYGVSMFNNPPEDLDQDIRNAADYSL